MRLIDADKLTERLVGVAAEYLKKSLTTEDPEESTRYKHVFASIMATVDLINEKIPTVKITKIKEKKEKKS